MIQYIVYSASRINKIKHKDLIISTLSSPKSLDEFDINIIDLNDEDIWIGNSSHIGSLRVKEDFKNLSIMIERIHKTKIVILLPQDCRYKYNPIKTRTGTSYEKGINLKNMLDILRKEMVEQLLSFSIPELVYENTETVINNKKYSASFYFGKEQGVLTRSNISKKVTTMVLNNIHVTTLKFEDYEYLIAFLEEINLIGYKQEVPEWFKDINMFDDLDYKKIIEDQAAVIKSANYAIAEARGMLYQNNEYKSILYTNGEELVTIVFKILEQILGYDLSHFTDEKKEDFLIKLEDITFIGEIKGVTSNVKSEHISQLDVHMQAYLDKIQESGVNEKVKTLLIMNHQRSSSIDKRQPVHDNQINLAKRNGTLIIETVTLLKLFEMFKSEEITSDDLKIILANNIGLLQL
ncbi:hypothetical protein [Cellulosilyticum sp. I15G10I2]|uniref:hypothetical protein n=1 Tax=Cellulosilyticum sp. I15G10I2 TaxID=1892843 RepID=UPI00085C27FF|nr:hypothetical protein [Cellulosilyticum sp. I15G10I2]